MAVMKKSAIKFVKHKCKKSLICLVVGDQEVEGEAVNVRKYGEQKSEICSILLQFVETLKERGNITSIFI